MNKEDNMKYTNAEHTAIQDGTKSVPVSVGNRDYDQIVADGLLDTIEPYAAPVKTWEEKRNEERGSIVSQWAYFIDNGYDALKAKDDAIKVKHPKR